MKFNSKKGKGEFFSYLNPVNVGSVDSGGYSYILGFLSYATAELLEKMLFKIFYLIKG